MWFLIASLLAIIGLTVYCIERWYRRPYIDGFQTKTVFITGTDSGFGFELAVNLARHGVKVYAGYYTEDGEKALQNATKDGLTTVKIDITNADSVIRAKEIVEEDLKQTGKELWGLVNNAGVLCGYTFATATRDDYRNTMEVNFFGTITVTETFLPLIKKSAGRIVNVISIAGRISGVLEPYTCSKHALEPYSDGLRRWMRMYKSHVAIIEPGSFKFTNLYNNSALEDNVNNAISRLPQCLKEEYGETLLLKMKLLMIQHMRNPPFAQLNHRSMVTNAIKHALFAQHPKDRYVCGWDARLIYRLAPIIPDIINDILIDQFLPFSR